MQLRSGKTYVYINFNRFVHYNKYIDIFIIKCLNYLNDIDNANKCSNNYVKNIKKIEKLQEFIIKEKNPGFAFYFILDSIAAMYFAKNS